MVLSRPVIVTYPVEAGVATVASALLAASMLLVEMPPDMEFQVELSVQLVSI